VSQTFASATVLGGPTYGNTLIRITDTDAQQAGGQPTGGLQFFTSDSDTPTAGVGAYVAALAEDSSPDTALVFGTRDAAGGGVDANERMRIDSVGTVHIGGTTTLGGVSYELDIECVGNDSAKLNLYRNDTSVGSGNGIGTIGFYGNDTTSNVPTRLAYINCEASGTHGAGDNPTDIVFGTTPDGTDIAADAVRIRNGGGLEITRTAVTAPTSGDGNVFSGTYTPALTNSTNVAASTPAECLYMRVGNVVTVSGQVNIDVTTTLTDSVLLMTLPIASTFTAGRQCGGTAASSTAGTYGAETVAILANVANGAAEFRLRPASTSNLEYRFSFSYRIL
jgi:hypothetical protein